MKVMIRMLFMLFLLGFSSPLQALAYPTADFFDFPIGGYNPNDNCLSWGDENSNFPGTRHVADDYCVAKDTQVKAAAKGRVKYINNSHSTWYAVMIIEHTLYNGAKVCSVYGHVESLSSIGVGTEITYVGQPIGKVIEYPPSSNHIHFGIYNGAFNATEGTYPSWLHGYLAKSSWPGKYFDPVDFVNLYKDTNPSIFPFANHSVIKFDDSPDCYLYSGGWLWPIGSELVFALLGFNNGSSCVTADFSHLINLSASQRATYSHLIRGESIPIQGMVARIVNEVGPNTCLPKDNGYSSNAIYLFDGTSFRPILNQDVYFALGYSNNWTDVVDVTQSLVNEYGIGYIIDSPDDAWWIQGPGGGGYLSSVPAPYNLQAEVLSSSQVKLDFYVPWVYSDFELILYQDGVEVSRGYDVSSVVISGIPPNTTHCFELSIYIFDSAQESARSNMVCPTTVNVAADYIFVDSYVSDSYAHGVGDEYWNLEPINIHYDFKSGDAAQFLVKLENVYVDHRFKMELKRNGLLLREQTGDWLYPDHSQGWEYSSFAPYQESLVPGEYEVIFYLDTGSGFSFLDSNIFQVSGSDYQYSGSWTCDAWQYGSGSYDYWDWQPVNPRAEFNSGETVYLLAQLNDVFVDHEWKMGVWKDGNYQWEWPSGWIDVNNVSGWGYSNFAPYLENATAGSYEFKLYLNIGSGFSLIDTKPFTVQSSNQTIPYFQDFTNGDDGFVLEDHLLIASLYLSDTEGFGGGKCLILNNTQSASAWQVQAKKIGFVLNQGQAYQGEIKIKGDAPGTIYIAVERAVNPWDNIGLWKAVNVTTSWQTVDLDFTATGNPQLDPDNIRFTIQAGEFVGNLYIDNVSLD